MKYISESNVMDKNQIQCTMINSVSADCLTWWKKFKISQQANFPMVSKYHQSSIAAKM